MPTPEQLAADAQAFVVETDSTDLVFLASELASLKDSLDALDKHRQELQKEYDALRKELLPATLAEAGTTKVRLPFGTLSLRHKTHASVRKDQQERARLWCIEAGRGELLTVSNAAAQALADECVEAGRPLPAWITTFTEEVATITEARSKEQ